MPTFVQEKLHLTDDQKKQVADLQKDVDAKLDKILTAEQKQQMKSMQSQTEVSRSKLQEAKSNFASAVDRRRAEIQQQRKEFETILG